MKKRPMLHLLPLNALLVGFLVWALCLGFAVHAAWAAPGPHPAPQEGGENLTLPEAPLKECAECHVDVAAAWSISTHAHTYDDPIFVERWKSLEQPGECLVCHTTGYSATTGEYIAEGVTCEACHGAAIAGHPPAIVPVRSDTEHCGACHTTTLGEWRLSGHSSADVSCINCHNPHSQTALFENPDEMCVNCHKDDLGEHKNDYHITKGIGCVDCHTLVVPPETPPPDGLVPTGHTFKITPATCVSCHTDTLHIGKPLPGYEDGAKAVAASFPETSAISQVIEDYTSGSTSHGSLANGQSMQALEAALASARLSTLFQGGIIGLVLGGSTAYFVARNQRGDTNNHKKAEDEESGTTESDEGTENA
jgi:predicted CXXCH cytochrome family protein